MDACKPICRGEYAWLCGGEPPIVVCLLKSRVPGMQLMSMVYSFIKLLASESGNKGTYENYFSFIRLYEQ